MAVQLVPVFIILRKSNFEDINTSHDLKKEWMPVFAIHKRPVF